MLNRFFALAAHNNKAYVELLFWKNVGAVREMTEGYSQDGLVLFTVFTLSQQYLKYIYREREIGSSLLLMCQGGSEAHVDRRGGRGVAEAVRGASSFRRLVLFAFFNIVTQHFAV